MDYHIVISKEDDSVEKIASFVNEHDRDVCIDALREEHPDVGEDYFGKLDD